MKIISIKTLIVCLLLLIHTSVLSTPVTPEVDNIASRFSVDMQTDFHLFADSINRKLVWYIPKVGGIKKVNGKPSFSVSSSIIDQGPFKGETAVDFDGIFYALSRTSSISKLSSEAASKGLYIKPAQVSEAETRVLLSGFQLDNEGFLKTTCKIETWETPNGPIQIPVCKALDDKGVWQEVDFLSSFSADLPLGGDINQDISFNGKTLPGWEGAISDLLVTGSSWDAQIQLLTDWKLKTNTRIKDARINIDWRTLVRYVISQMVHYRYWSITKSKLDNILKTAINFKKGISISYYQANGSITEIASSSNQQDRVRNNLIHTLRKKLFIPIFSPRAPIRTLVKQPDPINPYLPYTTPTYQDVQRKWTSSAAKVYSRVSESSHSLKMNQSSTYYPPRYCPYTSSLDTMAAYQCYEPEPCNYYEAARASRAPCYPPKPPVWEPRYILKSNYWRLLSFPYSSFNIYLNGIEIMNASTYMTVDCIKGDINIPLEYTSNCN